jgi:DNA-binding transcriptional regulator YdaS (Cro superfamily)
MKAIKRAIEICGSQGRLAGKIGVTQGLVSRWAAGETPIHPRHFLAIQKATRGKVTRYHLLDDELEKA